MFTSTLREIKKALVLKGVFSGTPYVFVLTHQILSLRQEGVILPHFKTNSYKAHPD